MKKVFLLIPALGVLALGACAPAVTGPVTPAAVTAVPPLPRTVRLSQNDDGTMLNLNVGDTLEISLPGNPGTGSTWQSQIDPWPTLESLGGPSFVAGGGGLGAGGLVTLSYQAVQPGQVELTLLYRRPFSPSEPTAQEFDVTVVVQ